MVLLVHHSISPQSRKVRLIMAEKKMLFVLKEEEPWKLSQDILDINPSGDLPVLVFDGKVVAGNYAVIYCCRKNYKTVSAKTGAKFQNFKSRIE